MAWQTLVDGVLNCVDFYDIYTLCIFDFPGAGGNKIGKLVKSRFLPFPVIPANPADRSCQSCLGILSFSGMTQLQTVHRFISVNDFNLLEEFAYHAVC
ncbi:hypothetical protein [Desulfonema ishimotonii]|uniref:hypothetical protein n=1 Tax=Desulfonema ishimotonii TaxID=45657 RepID=UPI000F568902|nr:hypothetical protein [Desulfonema ishimotonii]